MEVYYDPRKKSSLRRRIHGIPSINWANFAHADQVLKDEPGRGASSGRQTSPGSSPVTSVLEPHLYAGSCSYSHT